MTDILEVKCSGTQSIRCPSCRSHAVTRQGAIPSAIVFAGRTLDAPLKGGELFQCNFCHLGFRYPRLHKAQLDVLYREGRNDTWTAPDASIRNDWSIARRWIQSHFKSGNVLDVGCFDGSFLKYLGGNYQTFGIEIHPVAAQRAEKAGTRIVACDLEALANTAALYDAVVCFDVIEHVANPRFFLSQLAGRVKRNGHLIISSGNMDAWSWKLMGSRYWYCTIPEHISFVRPKWCRLVARELDLRILKTAYFSHARTSLLLKSIQFMKNMGYKIAPHFSGNMRTRGFGKKIPVLNHIELRDSPPNWISSRDHFLVVFTPH